MKKTLSIIFLTAGIYFLTKNPFTAVFKLHMTLVVFFVLTIFAIWKGRKGNEELKYNTVLIFLVTTAILFLIGSTGWYFSPFFFSLYLLGIYLSFVYSPAVGAGFIGILIGLFSLSIGEIDLAYDFMVVLSLFTVIPLSFYLRKHFLRIKEMEKEILILKNNKEKYLNEIDSVLTNTINNFAVTVKQPINDIKQIVLYLDKSKNKADLEEYKERIILLTEEAQTLIKDFEEKSTGKKLLKTPKSA